MNTTLSWKDFIATFPAKSLSEGSENMACRLMDLSHLGLISIPGEDSQTFLQGQLSCDLDQLTDDHCLLGSLSTPKGRLVSTLTVAKLNNTVHLLLHKDLITNVSQVLGKYIVFSKAKLEDQSDKLICFGLSGVQAENTLSELLTAPINDYDISQNHNLHCVKIPGSIPRYLIVAPLENAREAWAVLAKSSTISNGAQWLLENIEAGIAEISASTKEQFLPHNLNLHLTDGVNFEKGCYTGQEVIARMHYRAKLKSELLICELESSDNKAPVLANLDGAAIRSIENRNLGEVINAAAFKNGCIKALALLPKNENDKDLRPLKVLINNQEFNLNKVELPPYAINNE
ncbi:MAG: folate-binding protein YgfZ [Pseudomonadales bacterium]|nr:folate-binding protein YgfZ [Pseudomonadales bacterium]